MTDIKIVDNGLFDEIGRLNVHLNYNKLKQLEHQHAEIDKRNFMPSTKESAKEDAECIFCNGKFSEDENMRKNSDSMLHPFCELTFTLLGCDFC
ncbi:hypothetical protein TNCV_3201031 [Trichonephila clavipes]|nr:hypothetical protein TNCV_3201031 [Trichonephila clavipes]